MVVFLVLYIDDILLIENDVGTLSSVKVCLSAQFNMKDLGEASHILGIKLMRDRDDFFLQDGNLFRATQLCIPQGSTWDFIILRFMLGDSRATLEGIRQLN